MLHLGPVVGLEGLLVELRAIVVIVALDTHVLKSLSNDELDDLSLLFLLGAAATIFGGDVRGGWPVAILALVARQ